MYYIIQFLHFVLLNLFVTSSARSKTTRLYRKKYLLSIIDFKTYIMPCRKWMSTRLYSGNRILQNHKFLFPGLVLTFSVIVSSMETFTVKNYYLFGKKIVFIAIRIYHGIYLVEISYFVVTFRKYWRIKSLSNLSRIFSLNSMEIRVEINSDVYECRTIISRLNLYNKRSLKLLETQL